MKCLHIAKDILKKIHSLTIEMIGTPICDAQNFPVLREEGRNVYRIETENANVGIALKSVPYIDMYTELIRRKSYNLKMIDGALISLQYEFSGDVLTKHRLCFFPNPELRNFQQECEEYLSEELYADIVDQRIVAVPLRFDFDGRSEVIKDMIHPASHLTLGQYENCRIPVSRPIMPHHFLHFIIRNFYNTAYINICENLTFPEDLFNCTITPKEQKLLHIGQM